MSHEEAQRADTRASGSSGAAASDRDGDIIPTLTLFREVFKQAPRNLKVIV